jgi:hypothetical protein
MEQIWPLVEFDVHNLDILLGQSNSQGSSDKSKVSSARYSCWHWFSSGWCSDPRNLANFVAIKRHLPPIHNPDHSPIRPKPKPLPPLIDSSVVESVQSNSCGHICSSNAECLALSTGQCVYSARCAVDPSSMTYTVLGNLGNAVTGYAISRCLGQLVTQKGLGGRDVERYLNTIPADEDSKGWPCACNSTYVSYFCCSSSNGIIWEDSRLRLGSLEL